MYAFSTKKRPGFTIVELLVAIGIIAVLIAILLPAVQQAREASRRTGCQNQLRQIGLAMANYVSQFNLYPPGGVHTTTSTPGTIPVGNDLTDGRAPWTVLILPQLDDSNRYQAFNMSATFSCRFDLTSATPEPNLTQQYLPCLKYSCPSDPNSAYVGLVSNYAACQGGGLPSDAAAQSAGQFPRLFFNNGLFFHNSSVQPGDVTDGTSNTIMIGETKYIGTPASFVPTGAWWPWSASIRGDDSPTPTYPSLFNISATVDPINFPQNGQYTEADINSHHAVYQGCAHGGQQRVFGSWHRGGAHFAMADGSVHFLGENMDVTTYRSLGQRADGKTSSF